VFILLYPEGGGQIAANLLVMSNRIAADIGLLFIAVVWGSTFGVMKTAVADVDPMLFLFVRFTAATMGLLPVYAVSAVRRRRLGATDRPGLAESFKPGIALGLIFAAGFIAQVEGLRLTSATASGFITGMNVILVAVVHSLLIRSLPPIRVRIGILLATAGLLTIAVQKGLSFAPGDIITFVCAVFFGLHIVATDRYARSVDPVAVVLVQAVLIALITLALSVLRGSIADINRIPSTALLAAIYCGILATSVALVIQTAAQRIASSIETAMIYSLEPVFAALFAFLFFGENPGARTLVGGLMILAGILAVNLSPSRHAVPTESYSRTP
jgi:drug/metabolite transporter (DMT)-like permease